MTPTPTPANAREVIERMVRGYEVAAEMGLDDPDERIELESLRAALAALDAGQRFKDYTHQRLDAMGVPHTVPSPHTDAGCRIGGRMDWVEARLAAMEPQPDGAWVRVPRKATPKMIDATFNDPIETNGGIESHNTRNTRIWNAMLAAAPQQTEGVTEEMVERAVQSIMWLVFDYAKATDGFDQAEGEAREEMRTKAHVIDQAIRAEIRKQVRAALSSALEGRGKE